MPFTFSHPAAVLPLNYLPRKWVSLTALIIGSLMPDLEAYLRFKSEKDQSHTWEALLWFCLPIGFFICFLFHLYIRNPLVHHLPPFLYRRFYPYTAFSWPLRVARAWPVILLSLLIGGASHLAWDSLSHYRGILLQLRPDWDRNTTVFGYSVEIVYVIQYAGTLLGGLVIAIAIWQLPVDKKIAAPQKWWNYWLLVFLITVTAFCIRWLVMDRYKLDDLVISFFMALLLGIFISSLVFRQKKNEVQQETKQQVF